MADQQLTLQEFEVANLPSSVHLIRSFVSHEVSHLPLSQSAQFDVVAAVGEAADNSVIHGRAVEGRPDIITTRISRIYGAIQVEVRDNGPGFHPNLEEWPEPDLMAEQGRGVFIMESLVDQLVYRPVEQGTLCVIVKRFDEGGRGGPEGERMERGKAGAAEAPSELKGMGPPAIYRSLIENALEGVWVIDTDAKTIFVSERTGEMLGYSIKEMLGRPLTDFLAPESVQPHQEARERDRAGKSQQFEQSFLRKDGTLLHTLIATSPLYDERGRQAGSLGLLTDITKRKRAENELRESEQRYRSLFENMLDGFAYCRMIFDEQKRPVDFVYLEVNQSFERLTGLKDVVGKKVTEVIAGIRESNPELFDIYGHVSLTGKPERFELYLSQLDKWLSVAVYGPEPEHFVAVFDDVTPQKMAEKQAREELERTQLLREIAEAGARSMQERDVGDRLAAAVQEIAGARECLLIVLDESKRYLKAMGASGLPEGFLESLGVVSLDADLFSARVLRTGKPVMIQDVDQEDRPAAFMRHARTVGVRSVIMLPTLADGEAIGVLQVGWEEPRQFDPELLSFMESVAAQLGIVMQNARLFEAEVAAQRQAKQELETAELLLQAADVLNSWTELDALLHGLAAIVLELTKHKRVTIGLLDEAKSELKLAASAGEAAVQPGTTYRLDTISAPLREALAEGRTKVVDYDKLPEQLCGPSGRYSGRLALVAPLSYRGRVLGHIGVDDPGERQVFSEREIELVEGLASQASVVIDNVRLFEAEREARREAAEELETTRLLLRAADALAESVDLDGVLRSLIEVIVESTKRRRVVVSLYDAEKRELVVRAGEGEETIRPGFRIPLAALAPAIQRSVDEKRIFVVDYTAADMPEESRKRAQGLNTVLSLSVPIVSEGRIIGHMGLDDPGVRREFTEREIDIVRGVASQAAVAIENARLFAREHEAASFGEALHEIERLIHSTMKPDEILQRALEAGARALGAETAAIDTHEDGRFKIEYIYGWPKEILGNLVSDEQDTHGVLALRTGQVQAIDDTSTDPRVKGELMEEYGIKSVIVAPLIVGTEAFAALYFNYNSQKHSFTEGETDFVSSLGTALSLALQNARRYERERTIADTLQSALLTMPSRVEHLDFAYVYRGATEAARVGGDFYDLFTLSRGRVGVVIGDVSGKGLDAAALTSLTKGTIRANALSGAGPEAVMDRTDGIIHEQMSEEGFITALFGVLDIASGTFTYCNSGHPPPLVRRADKTVEELAVTGSLLGGLHDGTAYSSASIELHEGDVLLLYTDGLTEARSDGEQFGDDRVLRLLSQMREADSKGVVDEMLKAVTDFTQYGLSDDLALLAIRLV